jgi:hypothetical protein
MLIVEMPGAALTPIASILLLPCRVRKSRQRPPRGIVYPGTNPTFVANFDRIGRTRREKKEAMADLSNPRKAMRGSNVFRGDKPIMAVKTCPSCGKQFTAWRGKEFCSEKCRKTAENRRLRGSKSAFEAMHHDTPKCSAEGCLQVIDNAEINGTVKDKLRGDETFVWTACNEATMKLTRGNSDRAIGWAMLVGRNWIGRVRDDRGDWSFKANSKMRACQAVEAHINHAPFEPKEDEAAWRGDAMALVQTSP